MSSLVDSISEHGLLGILLSLSLIAIAYLYKNKENAVKERDDRIAELNCWIRNHAQDNIAAFKDVSNLIDKVMTISKQTEGNLSEKIEIQATDIKSHMSLEIEKLKGKVKGEV
jgi:hypothetical protein